MHAANESGDACGIVWWTSRSPARYAVGTLAGLLDITFVIQDGASGVLPLTLSDGSMSDANATDIPVSLTDGSITVAEAVVSITDGEAAAGATATLSVQTSAQTAIAGASFTVNFDASMLQVESVAICAKCQFHDFRW